MARKRITGPVPVCCIDCKHEEPVENEFPAWDGMPVFCTCQHWKHYRQRKWPQPCSHYEPKTTNK